MNIQSAFALAAATVCLSCASTGVAQDSATEDRLKVLRSQFEELKADVFSAQEKFDAQYLGELRKLEEKAKGAGKLELVLAIREEAEEFRTRKPVSAKPSSHADLARLQTIYDAQNARIRGEIEGKLATLLAGYKKQLADLQNDLTRAGKIEGAVVVQAELERIKAAFLNLATALDPRRDHSRLGLNSRFVRISLRGSSKILNLSEVEVYSGRRNVARSGKASQSTTWDLGSAEKAIDGKTDKFGHGETSHTLSSDDPWWEVDLGEEIALDKVVIFNRNTPGFPDHAARISGFKIEMLDEERKTIWEKQFGDTAEGVYEILIAPPSSLGTR